MSINKEQTFYALPPDTTRADMPAFPTRNRQDGWGSEMRGCDGLTIRDYYATHIQLSFSVLNSRLAVHLCGRPEPEFYDEDAFYKHTENDEKREEMLCENLQHALFWGEAVARYRFLMADMMVKARDA